MSRIPSDQQQLIAELQAHPAWEELRKWAHDQRDGYLKNLAEAMWKNPDVVVTASVREKAAFFRGMNLILNQPFFSAKAMARSLEQGDVDEPA